MTLEQVEQWGEIVRRSVRWATTEEGMLVIAAVDGLDALARSAIPSGQVAEDVAIVGAALGGATDQQRHDALSRLAALAQRAQDAEATAVKHHEWFREEKARADTAEILSEELRAENEAMEREHKSMEQKYKTAGAHSALLERMLEAGRKRADRAERALCHAGFEDKGGEEWCPPVNHEMDKVLREKYALETRITALEKDKAILGVACNGVARERDAAKMRAETAEVEVHRLIAVINTPEINDFIQGVRAEAAHQQERWGATSDAGKTDADWFWLIGYLAGKAIRPDATPEKRRHHIITTAAACLNWHRHLAGNGNMRPGIAPPNDADTQVADRDGAQERARILMDAKNHWANRARAAEATLAAIRARATDERGREKVCEGLSNPINVAMAVSQWIVAGDASDTNTPTTLESSAPTSPGAARTDSPCGHDLCVGHCTKYGEDRYPCSPTCTHEASANPDHPARVRVMLENMKDIPDVIDSGDDAATATAGHAERVTHRSLPVCGCCTRAPCNCPNGPRWPCAVGCNHPDSWVAGHPERVKERSEAFVKRAEDHHKSVSEGYEAGAEAMRAACIAAARSVMEGMGASNGDWDAMKAALEGAAP